MSCYNSIVIVSLNILGKDALVEVMGSKPFVIDSTLFPNDMEFNEAVVGGLRYSDTLQYTTYTT